MGRSRGNQFTYCPDRGRIFVDTPCGGAGKCGKCTVLANGAKLLACDPALLPLTQKLADSIEFLELASLPQFPKTFAKSMLFREGRL